MALEVRTSWICRECDSCLDVRMEPRREPAGRRHSPRLMAYSSSGKWRWQGLNLEWRIGMRRWGGTALARVSHDLQRAPHVEGESVLTLVLQPPQEPAFVVLCFSFACCPDISVLCPPFGSFALPTWPREVRRSFSAEALVLADLAALSGTVAAEAASGCMVLR